MSASNASPFFLNLGKPNQLTGFPGCDADGVPSLKTLKACLWSAYVGNKFIQARSAPKERGRKSYPLGGVVS